MVGIFHGATEVTSLMAGGKTVLEVYHGAAKVWPGAPPPGQILWSDPAPIGNMDKWQQWIPQVFHSGTLISLNPQGGEATARTIDWLPTVMGQSYRVYQLTPIFSPGNGMGCKILDSDNQIMHIGPNTLSGGMLDFTFTINAGDGTCKVDLIALASGATQNQTNFYDFYLATA